MRKDGRGSTGSWKRSNEHARGRKKVERWMIVNGKRRKRRRGWSKCELPERWILQLRLLERGAVYERMRREAHLRTPPYSAAARALVHDED